MKLEGGKYYWLRVKAEPDSTPEIGHCSCWVNSQGEQVVYFWLIAGEREEPIHNFDVLGEVEPYNNGEYQEVWPDSWPEYYNGTNVPCDMVIGPCCCGATHWDGEFELKYNIASGFPTLVRRCKTI